MKLNPQGTIVDSQQGQNPKEDKAMTREIRWRIITLQVILIVVFAAGAALAYWAADFTGGQIRSQLEPQKITFPKDVEPTIAEINEKYPDLAPYAGDLRRYQGQQVLNGEQAHVFAEAYLGVHVRDIDNGKPYSVLSSEARAEKDPALKAEKDAKVQTAFRGETLRSMLNQAWAFSVFGIVAMYAGIGLTIATVAVVGALVYELFFAKKPVDLEQAVSSGALTPATTRA
jgi:hypothetical protein